MKIQQFYIFLCCMIGLSTQYRVIKLNKKNSDDNPAPWQASLRIHGVHYCSGAIITTNVIVTAGECVIDLNAGQFEMTKRLVTVKVGSKNLYNGSVYEIEKIFFHGNPRNDKTGTSELDQALIEIKGSFDLTAHAGVKKISAVFYRGVAFPFDGEFNVSSWGYNPSTNNEISPTLTIKRWRGISTENCRQYYGDEYFTAYMFCAVSIDDNQKNPCIIGDIGDPALIDGQLIGVKIYKKDCQLFPNYPSLFGTIV